MDPERNKKIARDNSDIVFENNDFLIVRVFDAFSANYFISSETFSEEKLKNEIRSKEFYIIVDKTKDGKSYGMIVTPNSTSLPMMMSFNEKGIERYLEYNEFIDSLSPIEDEINQLFGEGQIYKTFKSFVGGKEMKDWELDQCDVLIKDVRMVKRMPGSSRVIISFNVDQYVDLFDLEDYYSEFAKYMLGYYYSSWDFGSWDRSWEEYKEGYIMGTFNAENIEKVKQIMKLIAPEISIEGLDEHQWETRENASIKIDEMYEKFSEKIRSTWSEAMEECYYKTAKDDVKDQLCGFLTKYGFYIKENACYEYYTTVNHILSLFNGKPKNWTLSQLFKSLVIDSGENFNFEDIVHGECYNAEWDEESYQNNISTILDDLLEEIESDEELFLDKDEYLKIYDNLTKKFNFDERYKLPKDDTKQILFKKIDPKTNLIHYLLLDKGEYSSKLAKGTYDQIMLLLYHPELDLK